MNKHKTFYWTVLFVTIIAEVIVRQCIDTPERPIDTKVRIIKAIDSLSNTLESTEILNHNELLISVLNQQEASAYTYDVIYIDSLNQARTIYIIILAAILSFLSVKFNRKALVVLSIFILIMYLVEVHIQDLFDRQVDCRTIISRTQEDMVNSNSLDSIWYSLDYTEFLNQQFLASDTRLKRKIWKSFNPNYEQIAFYIIPWFAIYIFLIRLEYKEKQTIETNDKGLKKDNVELKNNRPE